MLRHPFLLLRSFFSLDPHVAALRGQWRLGEIFLTQLVVLSLAIFLTFAGLVGYFVYEAQPAMRALPRFEIMDGAITTRFAPVILRLRDYDKFSILIDPALSIRDIVEKKRTDHDMYVVRNAFIVGDDKGVKYDVSPFTNVAYQSITPSSLYVAAPALVLSSTLSMPFLALILMLMVIFLAPMVVGCALLTTILLATAFMRPFRLRQLFAATLTLIPPSLLFLLIIQLYGPLPRRALYPVFFGLFMFAVSWRLTPKKSPPADEI